MSLLFWHQTGEAGHVVPATVTYVSTHQGDSSYLMFCQENKIDMTINCVTLVKLIKAAITPLTLTDGT